MFRVGDLIYCSTVSNMSYGSLWRRRNIKRTINYGIRFADDIYNGWESNYQQKRIDANFTLLSDIFRERPVALKVKR